MAADRELLELAAKAAGVKGRITEEADCFHFYFDKPDRFGATWAPLTDDGDALRLAVKLRLVIHVWDDDSYVSVAKTLPGGDDPADNSDDWRGCDTHGDPYAATRRAIVLAASDIGRRMP